jgi:hypothetical protein
MATSGTSYNTQTSARTGFFEFKHRDVEPPGSKNYGDYVVDVDKKPTPSTSYNAQTTTRTGFLEFKPRDMKTQKKYDAMSPTWEGVESSMKAVERGDYALDSAEKNRAELRKQTPSMPPPKPSNNCVIQ